MKQTIRSFALIVVAAMAVSAFAHDKHDKKAQDNGKAQDAKTVKEEFLGKGDGVTTCPVSGDEIHSKDVKGEFFNRTVYFCCAGCLDEAKKNPAAYIKKTHAEQVAATKDLPKGEGHHGDHHAEGAKKEDSKHDASEAHHGDHHAQSSKKEDPKPDSKAGEQKFLGKGDGVTTCPVTGEPVNKEFKGEVDGQTFYVCCPGCIETVTKNPAAYLKKANAK